MFPVPDNIFFFDNISISSPSLTWSTPIIATPWLYACVTLVVPNGQKIHQIPRCVLLSQACPPTPTLLHLGMRVCSAPSDLDAHMTCSPPGSSIRGLFQAGILEYIALSFTRGFSWPRGGTHVSWTGRRILYHLNHLGSPYFGRC